jgi:hypothetical protein
MDDGDHEGSRTRPGHPRVHQTVQRDHLVDNILSDMKKGVTTRSRVATFCQLQSFVSSLELSRWKMRYVIRIGWWPCKKS